MLLILVGLLPSPILAQKSDRPSPSARRQSVKRAVIDSGKLTAINGTILTVAKDDQSYAVNTGTFDQCATKIVRRFGGKSAISELSIGDILNITGFWVDDAKTAINACSVRDRSIQIRFAVLVGEVTSLNDSGWTMSLVGQNRPDQTILVSGNTKYVDRRNQAINRADIQVGHRVRVKGLWNNQTNVMIETQKVKDFDLPDRVRSTQ